MGLVQRELELFGISTISLSTIHAFTASVGAPRVAAIEYPGCQPLGAPHDREGQRAVLRGALEALAEIEEPGTVVHLPFEWKGSFRSAPKRPPPITRMIKRKPWLLLRLLRGTIPG